MFFTRVDLTPQLSIIQKINPFLQDSSRINAVLEGLSGVFSLGKMGRNFLQNR